MENEKKRPADDRKEDSADQSNDSGSEETPKKKRKIDWAKFTSTGDRQESLTGETEQGGGSPSVLRSLMNPSGVLTERLTPGI